MEDREPTQPLLPKAIGVVDKNDGPTPSGSGIEAKSEIVKDATYRNQNADSSSDSESSISENSEEPTQWRGLFICGLLMYLTTSMGQTLAVSGWPYLRTIDPTVPVSFLGLVQALTRFGHAAGSCVFAVHAYTYKTFKRALIIGHIISVLGCAFYILIELFSPAYRRWAYLAKFLMQSVAEGSLIVVRSYVPRMSREVDRQQAFSIIEGANMLAIVSGPLVQLACHALPQEGTPVIGDWLRFNIYTVPIWISLILNIVTLLIAIFFFHEPTLNELEGDRQLSIGKAMRKALKQITQLDRYLVVMCFVEKSVVSYGFAAMYTIMSPYVTESFNVSEAEALFILSVAQSFAGVVSLFTVAAFVFTPLAKVAKARYLFPFALSCYFLMYLFSYPWPGITETIPRRDYGDNATNPYGCDWKRYDWCGEELKITNHYAWLGVTALLFGIGIPISLISFDTIFSKVLGSIDQNIMQGLLIIMDDVALAGAPVVSTLSFIAFGPGPMWLSVAGICAFGLLVWMAFMPKLRKLDV